MTDFRYRVFKRNNPLRFMVGVFCFFPGAVAAELGDLSDDKQPLSTRQMNQRLAELWRESNPIENFYLSERAVEAARLIADEISDSLERIGLLASPERYLLFAGHTEQALQELARIESQLAAAGISVPPDLRQRLLKFKAICHLRLGEQQNCLLNHNADSCLFPIAGGGIHLREEGSRQAIGLFEQVLANDADDLEARWLLNIAYMTLGEYPGQVPPAWLIDPATLASDFDVQRFPDVAGALGVAIDDLAGGVVLDDFDRDGWLDLMVSGSGPDSQLRLFRNQGDASFADRTIPGGLEGVTGGLNLIQADYDNDGDIDVLVLRTGWLRGEGLHPNSLLRNNGDFTFTDVTEEAGLLSYHPTQTAVWFDYNGDGWVDLFVGNETWTTGEDQTCELYRNNGDGTFTETSRQHRLHINKYVKAVVAGDFNNDGRPDLYLSLMGGLNLLYRNEGPARGESGPDARWRFRNVAARARVAAPFVSFPGWFWDYDNDGWLDLFVSGYHLESAGDVAADYLGLPHNAETPRLYRNLSDGTFEDVTERAGLNTVLHTMGSNFGDLDNDGWLDFYAGTGDPDYETLIPSRMFRNDGRGGFQDVTTSGGFGQLQKGHGIAFGDIDNDGDQEVYSVTGGVLAGDHYPNQLFANPGHGNRWLKLELEGVTFNRSALGARIVVVVLDAEGRERSIHRTVGSGGSFGASPLRQEIGLGAAREIKQVEISWPTTDATQVLTGLALDKFYRVREDRDDAIAVELTPFTLPDAGASSHSHH